MLPHGNGATLHWFVFISDHVQCKGNESFMKYHRSATEVGANATELDRIGKVKADLLDE